VKYTNNSLLDKGFVMLFFFGLSFLILCAGIAFAANEVIDVKVDGNLYMPGAAISIEGVLYSADGVLADSNVSIVLNDTSTSVLTDSEGVFEVELNAPSVEGEYNIVVSYGSQSISIPIKVSQASDIELSLISAVSESYRLVIFGDNESEVGINSTGSLAGNLTFGNFTSNSTTYFVIAQKDEDSGEYDTLFITDDMNFNTIKFSYIVKDSKIKLSGSDYTLVYMDPDGSQAIIARKIIPSFYGTGSEWAKLLILLLNETGSLINNLSIVELEHIDEFGNQENITNETAGPADISVSQYAAGRTNYGFKVQSILISTVAGKHNLIVDGTGFTSYFVNKFTLNIGVETTDGKPLSMAKTSQTVMLKAGVVDLNTGVSTSDATVTVRIIYPDGSEETYDLTANDIKLFVANFTTSDLLTGQYQIIFTANYSGTIIKKQYSFTVKNTEFFMKAFSKEKGEGSGFPPGSSGYIIIGAKETSTNSLINLSNITGGCLNTSIYISGLYDSKSVNRLTTFVSYDLQSLWAELNPPDWVRSDIVSAFGSGACAIKFTTPSSTGTYGLETKINVSNSTVIVTLKEYLDVTSLFIHAMPANCITGSWTGSFAPGSRVCLKINIYDAATGSTIPSQNITSTSLIEVFNPELGVITDQITGVSTVTFSGGTKGISFYSSNTSLGSHNVLFRVEVNDSGTIKSGVGYGWYRTELWNVWAYPYCNGQNRGMFCSFGSSSTIQFNIEAFAAGFSDGQEDLTVSVSAIKNFDTGETVQITADDSSSCTTVADNSSEGQDANNSVASAVMPATCTLTLPTPEAGWTSGNYELKLSITDTDDNQMYVYSWFKVENFRFWAWNRNWEITTSQDAQFEITVQDFDGTPLEATVSLNKAYYMGSEDSWSEPREISISVDPQSISGSGTFTIPAASLAGLSSGFYDLVFTAVTNSGSQTTRAGMSLRSFVVVSNQIGNNWDRKYEIGGNLTVNITAFDTVNWSIWPPTGTPHNITNATVQKVVRNGMWDNSYKQSGRDTIGDSSSCSENSCILTMPLTGFEQSNYEVFILVTDESGNTATTNYWFTTELFTITIPDIQDWRNVPVSNKLVEEMDITLGTDVSCGTSSDPVIEPPTTTKCLFDSDQKLPTIYNDWPQFDAYNKRTAFLLDISNSSDPFLYVNTYNDSWQDGYLVHNNFTMPETQGPLGIGDYFNDSNGYEWNVTAFDSGLGAVTLQSLEGVIRTRTKQADGQNTEVSVEYMYQYIVDKSLSQSGIFLYSGSGESEDKFWDDEWANIDLDNDGVYNCHQDNDHYGSTCEEYYMLLADRSSAGSYDTLLLSPTRDMTIGVDSYDGFTGSGTGDIRFNESADPIYLINMIYSETGGVGRYKIVTTTNRAGWAGRNIGLFQVGSEHVKVPIMVASPSTKQGIAGKQVFIRTFRTFGQMNFEETTLATPGIGITGSNGITLLDLNLSDVEGGEYIMIVEVNDSGTFVTSGNDWDNPKIELRSFSLSNLLGYKKSLDAVVEWSQDNNNLFRLNSAEMRIGNVEQRMQCNMYNNDMHSTQLCHVDDWRYRMLWVNISDLGNISVFKDPTPDDWYLSEADSNASNETTVYVNETLSIDDEFGGQVNYIVSGALIETNQAVLDLDEETSVQEPGSPCSFLITVTDISIGESRMTWDVSQQCPWSSSSWSVEQGMDHMMFQSAFLWYGIFNISSMNETSVTINVFKKALLLSSPVQEISDNLEEDNDGRIRVVSNPFSSGYDLYIYNDNRTKTRSDLEGWSGSLDTVAVVNNSDNSVVNTYTLGEVITELVDKAVVQADSWDQYVYLSNLTINGNIIFPLPWSCDDKKYYVATFTEQEIGFELYNCQEYSSSPDMPYYIILFDSICDGVSAVNQAKMDDDYIIDDNWANIDGQWRPYDFSGLELGSVNACDIGQSGNSSERWIDIGKESWPISITDYSDVSSGTLDIFKTKWSIDPDDTATILSLWVQAKNFDGTNIDGTISIDKATGTGWQCGMMQEEDLQLVTYDGNINDSIGYLDINLSNLTSPQPTIKFKVADASNPAVRFEYITKSFWYGPAQNNGGDGGEDCGDMFKDGFSGGGEGFMDEEAMAERERCLANSDSMQCAEAGCAWVEANAFGEGKPPENQCLPCMAFSDDEEGCMSYPDSCRWVPAGGIDMDGMGICETLNNPCEAYASDETCESDVNCIWIPEEYDEKSARCSACFIFDADPTSCTEFDRCEFIVEENICDPICSLASNEEECDAIDCDWTGDSCE